jgi:hypothetical protein
LRGFFLGQSMSASQPAYFHLQEFSDGGVLLLGGRLYTYAQGTTVHKTAYTDAAGAIPQTYTADGLGGQYIALDARGELPAPLYMATGSYDIALKRADGSTVWTRRADPIGDGLVALLITFLTAVGASLIGFIQAGAATVLRTVQSKLRDRVSVFDFLTEAQIDDIRNGTQTPALDPTAAIQAGINANTVFAKEFWFPAGVYRFTDALTSSMSAQKFTGEAHGTYLLAAAGSTHDIMRIANQRCKVSGFIFRPVSTQTVCLRLYAGRIHVHDNYFLSGSDGANTAIEQSDINPVTLAFIPGAYAHTIENNTIGDAGYAFQFGIHDGTTMGMQASKYRENRILSDRPIVTNIGGGNVYGPGNLFQSDTGTAGLKAGVGVSLGATVSGEKIFGNYFELYLAMVATTNVSTTYQIFNQYANHNDNCTATVSDAGSKNYINEDSISNVESRNGWTWNYASASLLALNTPAGNPGIGVDSAGNVLIGTHTGSSHIVNRAVSSENTVVTSWRYAGVAFAYMQDARGGPINAANTCLGINKNTVTSRSISAVGTVNVGGADYAEYMLRWILCGLLGKGQVVGITSDGELTDKWFNAVAFMVKSTNPSIVGGDTWAAHLGEQPEPPVRAEPKTEEVLVSDTIKPTPSKWGPGAPREPGEPGRRAVYKTVEVEGDTDKEWVKKLAAHEVELATWNAAHEEARARVDRIAFAGQVPVNVWGATPGDYIVPVQDGEGIKGIAVKSPTFEQYMAAVGKVIAIEPDGRARIIVKVS